MAKKTESNETEQSQPQDNQEQPEQSGIVENVIEAVSTAASNVVETVNDAVESVAGTLGLASGEAKTAKIAGRRAQKVGTVSSDKMTKTVVVNVDRQVMHPKYRRYVRRTTKFMAHDEMQAGIGDKVKIEETRPMSARKRWRVVEIIQKAAK